MAACNRHLRFDFAPQRRMRLFGIAVLLIAVSYLATAPFARAQAVKPPAQDAQSTLTPVEAQHALEVLQDAGKRDALIETLRTIAIGSPPAASQPAAPSALAADGFGAEALLEVSSEIGDLSAQFEQSVRAVTRFPALWRWLTGAVDDPETQTVVLGFLWRGLAVVVLALLAERLVQFVLRRPFAALEARAARDSRGAVAVATVGDDEPESPPSRRAWRLRAALGRVPYAAARLVMDVAPVATFFAAGNALVATSVGADPVARIAILAVVNAYVFCRAAMCVVRMFVCSSAPGASLFAPTRETAAAIESWSRRLIGVTVFGLAFANVARALGLERSAYHAMVKLVVLIPHLLLVVVTLRYRRAVASFIRAPAGHAGLLALLRNRFAEVWHYVAIFSNLALWTIWAFRIPNGYSLIAYYASEAVVILAIARAAWAVAVGALDRALRPRSGVLAGAPTLELLAARYRPVLRFAISAIIAMAALAALLETWGVDALSWFEAGRVGATLLSQLSSVVLAVAVAVVVWEACNGAIERQLARFAREGAYARASRLRTLVPMMRTVLTVTILTVAGLTVLSAIGVNIAPLLAGAGIVGIAVGFGSQKLVQDLVTGVFLLLENAMQVGDWVTVSGLSGTVENLSIRTIRLRAGDGSVHIIPFSAVTSVTNTNRGIGNAAISVNLAYDEDVDRAGEVLKEVAAQMRKEPQFKPLMRGDLDLWGVDKFDGATVTLVGQIVCTDAGRWPVQREFNRRMKIRFQELGVDLAYPTQARFVAEQNVFGRKGAASSAAE